jgi:hypothetical protein
LRPAGHTKICQQRFHCRWLLQNLQQLQPADPPLGPRVTDTASATLLIPFCSLRLESTSKTISFASAALTTCVRKQWVRACGSFASLDHGVQHGLNLPGVCALGPCRMPRSSSAHPANH